MTAQPTPTNQEDIEDLRNKLAEIEHERWADWQAWCHKILRENCPSPELEAVLERWDRQIATPYKDLTDQEKASDMEQVDRYWSLIQAIIANKCNEARIDELDNQLPELLNFTLNQEQLNLIHDRLAELTKGDK